MITGDRKGRICVGVLVVVMLCLAAANLLLGSVDVPAEAVWRALAGRGGENEVWTFIVWSHACRCV